MVGATSTPFVVPVGIGRMIADTRWRASLSKTISWPRRGVTVNSSWPSMRSTTSLCRPAALISQRARITPAVVDNVCRPSSSVATAWTVVFSISRTPAVTASVA